MADTKDDFMIALMNVSSGVWVIPGWDVHRVMRALQEPQAKAEPLTEAEPVAWRIFDGEGGYDFREELPSEESRAWSARYGRQWEPLYAAPRKQLTDEQIRRIYEVPELAGTQFENGTEKAIAVARAIERAHGIAATTKEATNA